MNTSPFEMWFMRRTTDRLVRENFEMTDRLVKEDFTMRTINQHLSTDTQ